MAFSAGLSFKDKHHLSKVPTLECPSQVKTCLQNQKQLFGIQFISWLILSEASRGTRACLGIERAATRHRNDHNFRVKLRSTKCAEKEGSSGGTDWRHAADLNSSS